MQLTITVDSSTITKDLDAIQAQGLTSQSLAEGDASHSHFICERVCQFLTSYGQQAQERLIEELRAAFLAAPAEKQAEYAKKLRDAQAAGFMDAAEPNA